MSLSTIAAAARTSGSRGLLAALALGLACGHPAAVRAQVAPGAPAAAPATAPSAADLETMVAPIALYPDDLLGIILPSATTPLDVVKGQRFLERRKATPSLEPDAKLPEPVRNLLNYPEIVAMMSQNLDWTIALGEAVVDRQREVMTAIQAFRRKAQAAGNLKSDDKQLVIQEQEVVKIVPADPQVIYVPQYQPATVIVQQAAPAIVYAPTPYPVYYYPYPPGVAFATGLFVGATTAYAVGWINNSIRQEHWENHYHDVEHYQQNRMDYANQSREDWQSHSSQQQAQRQQEAQSRQTQRQEQVGQAQGQRQDAATQNQAQRQQAAGQAQQQRAEMQGQRQQAAQGAQRPAQGQRPQGSEWKPQPGGRPAGGAQATSAQARPGTSLVSGTGGGAFGGVSAGSSASFESQRGASSRAGSANVSRGSAGGARGGGGGRRR